MLGVVDTVGPPTTDAADGRVTDEHEDRVVRVRSRTGYGTLIDIVPALPPGVRDDPDLAAQAEAVLGCSPVSLPLLSAWRPADRHAPARMVTASHSWAAVAFARAASADPRPAHLVHLDAHDDFAPPPPGRRLDVTSPASIARSVRAGHVGIGSFIAPFSAAGRLASFAHVTLAECSAEGGRRHRPRLADGNPLWLDVDLDVLCNALDDRRPTPMIDAGEFSRRLDGVSAFLAAALPDRPALVTVALSPGFLPSRFWRPGLDGLARALRGWWPGLRMPWAGP